MSLLKKKCEGIFPGLRDEIKSMVKEHGAQKISDVTIAQAYGGMRGVKGMICDTSLVEPDKGLIIRGIPCLDLTEFLPEEIFWLLLTGERPNAEELKDLQGELAANAEVPQYVVDVLKAMPKESHPMAMLDTAILVMECESKFRAAYDRAVPKTDYWIYALEDAIRILGVLPGIAAHVYRLRYDKGEVPAYDPNLDWGANYAQMLGCSTDPKWAKLMQLYLTLHSDHEGGNVSANTCHTVGSALSDPYYAVSAGLNGLAGPLHGLANQECLGFVLKLYEQEGGVPSDERLTEFCWEVLKTGVIPGYGHAVLRVPDPRFVAFRQFGEDHMPEDPIFQIVDKLFNVVPGVLKEHGKAANPWPNVDAGSGALLYHFGLREFPYYTVLFSVSRAMGMLSQLIWNRGIGTSITRPKSVGTDWIKAQIANA